MIERSETQWEKKYYKDFCEFIDEVYNGQPDYIIPVARKSCKLLSTVSGDLDPKIKKKIFYQEYFDFNPIDLSNKKIAIIDDVSHRATTIKDYRDNFLNRGCKNENIKTYAFIGHEDLRSLANKFDKEIIIFKNRFFAERKYQEYLSVQSNHLLLKNFQTDIDHLVIQTQVNEFKKEDFNNLISVIDPLGFTYELNPIEGLTRIGVQFHSFLNTNFISEKLNLDIKNDFFFKLKLVYEEKKERLTCIPIYFPKVKFNDISKEKFCESDFPFQLPLNFAESSDIDQSKLEKMMFWNVCLFCNSLVARYFYCQLAKVDNALYSKFEKSTIRANDLSRYLGENVAEKISNNIKDFISLKHSPFDISFEGMKFNEGMFPKTFDSNINSNLILDYLRQGYKKEAVKYNKQIEQKKNPRKPEFDATVEKLMEVGNNIHPVLFSIFVDELCDLGILVPRTKYIEEENCWRRVYRSGENEPDVFSWKRTLAILTIALTQIGEKNQRIYLEKVMANFTNDFAPYIDRTMTEFKDSHCIYTIPYLFGPINQTLHYELFSSYNDKSRPFQFFNPNHLLNVNIFSDGEFYKEISELIICQKPDKTASDYKLYTTTTFALNADKLNQQSLNAVVDGAFLYNYFEFYKLLSQKSGNVKHILSLAIGRDQDLFQSYISYNINAFFYYSKGFIDKVKRNVSSTNIEKDLGLHIDSIQQKLDAIEVLQESWIMANSIATNFPDSLKFDKVWKKILGDKTLEETLKVAKTVMDFASKFRNYMDQFELIENIVKQKNGINVKSNNKNSETIVKCGFHIADFYDSHSELIDSTKLLNSLEIFLFNLQANLNSLIKEIPKKKNMHLDREYGLNKFFLNLDIYENKNAFLESLHIANQMLADAYGSEYFKLKDHSKPEGNSIFEFENSFHDKVVIQLSPNGSGELKRIDMS